MLEMYFDNHAIRYVPRLGFYYFRDAMHKVMDQSSQIHKMLKLECDVILSLIEHVVQNSTRHRPSHPPQFVLELACLIEGRCSSHLPECLLFCFGVHRLSLDPSNSPDVSSRAPPDFDIDE